MLFGLGKSGLEADGAQWLFLFVLVPGRCTSAESVPRTSVAGRVEFWAEATQASSEMRSLCERVGGGT